MKRHEEHDIRRKTKVLDHAKLSGNVSQTYRYFGVFAPNARLRALVTAYAGQPPPSTRGPENLGLDHRASSADNAPPR